MHTQDMYTCTYTHAPMFTHTHKPPRQRTNTLLGGWAVFLTQVGSRWNQGTSYSESLFLSHSLWDEGTSYAEDVHRGWMEIVLGVLPSTSCLSSL